VSSKQLLDFLADNPHEVLILYIEDRVLPWPLAEALVATGLVAHAHVFNSTHPATLGCARDCRRAQRRRTVLRPQGDEQKLRIGTTENGLWTRDKYRTAASCVYM
jgi:hypothetical protein